MKKCPKCGNPSYDGAPVCGNCGYVFPKAKATVQKRKSIFEQNPEQIPNEKPKVNKTSSEPSVIDIIKEKKLIIGTILLITLIVICGIFITGSNNNNGSVAQTGDLVEYAANGFSFKYPSSWEQINSTDEEHENAVFYETDDNVIVEYYNVTTDVVSLKEINQERINTASYNGDYVDLLETITIGDKNASNIITEDANGEYSRYVSMLGDGELYVFKIIGDSINSTTTDSINSMINSAEIQQV